MHRLRNFGIDNARAQVDFPKMIKGGVDASFFALFTPNTLTNEQAAELADKMMAVMRRQVGENADKVAFAYSAEEVYMNKDKGLISILIGMENGSPICGSLDKLRDYYRQGVRYLTLTHNGDNDICDSCAGNHRWGGLSPFGKTLIPEMNRCRMLIDVAHAADTTIRDVLALSSRPVAYTHGGCRALASHRRNLPDELIRGIAEAGGVVCISIYPPFLSDDFVRTLAESGLEEKMSVEDAFIADPADPAKRAAWEAVQLELQALPRPGVDRVADHIEHAVSVAGIDHVGIGTDYDGIEVTVAGLEDISRFPALWDELRRRGFSARDLTRLAGANLLRLLTAIRK